ncbi:MAG: hypothetical protein IJY47_08140 [Clostridia bacterium]|nr:hypothetical protein [Clostridia bacterium]
MMTLTEKASYLKGMADGMELDQKSKEGKLIGALIDLVSEMAEEIAEMAEDMETLNDYVEELDEDLGGVEELLYDDECDCCDEDDELECDGNCDCCDEDCELNEEDYFEVECPSCGDTICFDSTIDPEELVCPACGEKFECLVSEEDLKALDAE